MTSKIDYMGRAVIEPEDCSLIREEEMPESRDAAEILSMKHEDGSLIHPPRWHSLHYAPGEPECGQVLVQFIVVETDYNFKSLLKEFNLASLVETKEHTIELLILGLRNLQSPGILPVKKAFIKFGLKSMMPPGLGNLTDIKT